MTIRVTNVKFFLNGIFELYVYYHVLYKACKIRVFNCRIHIQYENMQLSYSIYVFCGSRRDTHLFKSFHLL